MISLQPLSPERVLAFLPPNTWTEVILLSTPQNNINAYIATTPDNMQKRFRDMNEMALQSCLFEPVLHFKAREIVAVEIDGNWYRGKLIKLCLFNPDDTTIDLIDVGVTYKTKLQYVFEIPYYFKYEPLVLPIKFKNFTPNSTKVIIKPCMSDSILDEGFVLVEAKSNHIKLENIQQYDKPLLDTKQEFKNKKIIKAIKCEPNDDLTIKSSSHMEQNEIYRSSYQYSHPRHVHLSAIKIERDKTNGQLFSRPIKIENDTSFDIGNPSEIMLTNKHSFTDESYTNSEILNAGENINNIHKELPSQKLIKRKKSNVKRQEKLTPNNWKNSRKKEKKESKKQLAQDKNLQKQEQTGQSKPQEKNLTEEIRYRFEQLVKFTAQQLQEMNY
ncbi:Tudor domain [Cinara cedri]|uniref:Tudor domain n=1 Tax=Cinara cedri TaxID=506608 RepID=A0A5E4M4N6_9HEMI|nr:Tudor domain [Cinara cedri]